MGRMIKACIFDLDGTLVNSLRDLQQAVNVVLAGHGYPQITDAQTRQMVGNGIRKLIERALPAEVSADAARVDVCLAAFSTYYRAHCLDNTRPYPGIPELLDQLKQRQLPAALISNKADPMARQIAAALFPAETFGFVTGMREGFLPKPDPSALFAACRHFGVQPEDCVMIGDSNVDMQTAHNAGMQGIGVTWGFRSPEELRQSGAAVLVSSTAELFDAIVR